MPWEPLERGKRCRGFFLCRRLGQGSIAEFGVHSWDEASFVANGMHARRPGFLRFLLGRGRPWMWLAGAEILLAPDNGISGHRHLPFRSCCHHMFLCFRSKKCCQRKKSLARGASCFSGFGRSYRGICKGGLGGRCGHSR